jgi:hypothetical protein
VAENGSFTACLVPHCFPTYSSRTRWSGDSQAANETIEVAAGSLAKPSDKPQYPRTFAHPNNYGRSQMAQQTDSFEVRTNSREDCTRGAVATFEGCRVRVRPTFEGCMKVAKIADSSRVRPSRPSWDSGEILRPFGMTAKADKADPCQTTTDDGRKPGVSFPARSRRGTRFRTASLLGRTRQRRRRFCASWIEGK